MMTDGANRYLTLDAIRGFAVMGILAMNIIAFAMPEMAYVTPVMGGKTSSAEASYLFSFIFIDGKMRGLFSLLFGASMMLVIERAEAKGENPVRVHYARMLWLALFGFAHYLFIWWGDILFLYAVIGCLAFLMHRWEPGRLIKWALMVYMLGFLLYALQFGGLQILQYVSSLPGADPALVREYKEIMASDDLRLDATNEIAAYSGGYAGILAWRWNDIAHIFDQILQSITETLPLMMLGMALLKNGFLTGQRDSADYARWAKRMLIPGLLLNALLALWVALSRYDLITAIGAFMAWSMIPRLMITIGYAALLILVVRRLSGSAALARLAAAGQAAFTNYLGTSIIMSTLFYGYGLGLYNQVPRASLWLFVAAAWLLMLLWSKPWLDHFRYGPLEWLWRSLARMQLQPMQR